MDLGLQGRTAIVCAASKGLGRACAEALAAEGVNLILNARNAAQLEQSASEISTAHKVSVKAVAGDIASATGREAVLAACSSPDILVNNAGGPPPGKLKTWTADDWSRALEGNLRAPAAMLAAVLEGMAARGFGRIVNITSSVAYEDPPNPAGEGGWGLGYAFSKGALHRIAGILSVEQRTTKVNAYNVQPGFIATERMIQDMGPFGFDASTGAPAAVLGKACRWLLESPDAPDLNGQNIEAQVLVSERGLLPGWSLPS